jgi:cell division protein ZapE
MTEGPINLYRARLDSGRIEFDSMQALAAEKLQSLHHALVDYRPTSGQVGWKARLGLARRNVAPPQGLYIFGPVGTGKSMLMDLFFEAAPIAAKRRVHFHAFMQEVHDRLHGLRARAPEGDPLPAVAKAMAEEAWLFCFDEFQVVNIADAMILARLFGALFELGAIVVATSNTAPDRLYEGGLQRENFLPFVALLKDRLDVLELDGGVDYRRRALARLQVYHWPLGAEAEAALDGAFAALTAGAAVGPVEIQIKGRRLAVPAAARGVARIGFAELCEAPLGAADYLALAQAFHSLVLSGVPRMAPARRNEARRFMTLIDALYEHRVDLVISADGPPETLYPEGHGAEEFQRTVSRLIEMQTRDYIARPHAV